MGIPITQEKHTNPVRCAESPAETKAGVGGLETQAPVPSPHPLSWLPWETANQKVYILLISNKQSPSLSKRTVLTITCVTDEVAEAKRTQ